MVLSFVTEFSRNEKSRKQYITTDKANHKIKVKISRFKEISKFFFFNSLLIELNSLIFMKGF